jgi:regulator of protease activity HflC (stomatin/prohibitin superfamily)
MFLQRVKIRSYEKGLLFRDQEFEKILDHGSHWCMDITGKTKVEIVSMRNPWLVHEDLDLIIASGLLGSDAEVVELAENERGLVWVENRFHKIIGPERYVLWKGFKEVRVERVDTSGVKFTHKKIRAIIESEGIGDELDMHLVEQNMVGVLFIDGDLQEVLNPGCHVFWRKTGDVKVLLLDTRETTLDVGGQDIMTRDKVSLRLNGLTTYKVVDPVKAVTEVEHFQQSLYRETQLALRAVVGTRDLDVLLADKDSLAVKIRDMLSARVRAFGLAVIGFGIRDIILPGDMKELLNRVVESQKAAEANLITRQEETAAMRSQANTAKILDSNPTLMRLRELELLEKVAASSKLKVVCGEGALTSAVLKLI